MDDDVRQHRLLQGAFECVDEMMGQLADKAHGICQQDLSAARKIQQAGGGIQSGEKGVLLQNLRSGQHI